MVEVSSVPSSAPDDWSTPAPEPIAPVSQLDLIRPDLIRPDVMVRRLLLLGIGVALGMVAVGALLLFDSRQDTWAQAERSSINLVQTLERDISRNIAVYDLSLIGAIDALEQPGIRDLPPGLRQAAIFDRAASAEYLGSLLVLDRAGNIVYDSTSIVPHTLNVSDRDYFQVHRDNPDRGLFVSEPFRSRLRNNDSSIAISRRLSGPDGEFEGVVVGTLRLAYFSDMFRSLNLGQEGAVLLLRDDGLMIARYPLFDETMNRDFSRSPITSAIIAGSTGSVLGRSSVDGVDRLFEYRRIGSLPLHIAVGLSVREVLAPWWRKATVIGGILAVLAGSTVLMCLLFRREMSRRLLAEASLLQAANRLEMAAKTDALTGLPNRRAFQEGLDSAWRGAVRAGTVLSLLMIDADGFKLFNDRYGHQEGDRALKAVGESIRWSLRRPADMGARYGGEEFAVLLPDTDLGAAVSLAERIRCHIRDQAIPHEDGPDSVVTVSIGVSTVYPQNGDRDRILVRTADAALYDAKHAGRNRVCVNTAGASQPARATIPAMPRRDARGIIPVD